MGQADARTDQMLADQAAGRPLDRLTKKAPRERGNPFTGAQGAMHFLQMLWCCIWNPFALHTWFAARRIVKEQFGTAIGRGKVMFLMPIAMMSIYCLTLSWVGVPVIVLGPLWWLTLVIAVFTAVADIETRWLALPIGLLVAIVGGLSGFVAAGLLDISGVIGDVFSWLALEFPVRGALFLAAVIVVWNIKDFAIRRATDVVTLLNNSYVPGRLSTDGDYPAGSHRSFTHISDWLEWAMCFSVSFGVRSIMSDKPESDDERLDKAAIVRHHVPLGGLYHRAATHATSTTNVEKQR